MQKLHKLLETKKPSGMELARRCGVSQSTISRVASGKLTPSLPLVAKIIRHTDGKVTAQDFIDTLEA